MASFTKKTNENGTPIYRNVTDNVPVKKENVPETVLAKLDIAPEGTPVPEDDSIDTSTTPLAPEPKETVEETERIHLDNTLCVNGKAYLGGTKIDADGNEQDIYIKVPKEMASDLQRMDRDYKKYERDLHRGQDFSLKKTGLRVEAIQESQQ